MLVNCLREKLKNALIWYRCFSIRIFSSETGLLLFVVLDSRKEEQSHLDWREFKRSFICSLRPFHWGYFVRLMNEGFLEATLTFFLIISALLHLQVTVWLQTHRYEAFQRDFSNLIFNLLLPQRIIPQMQQTHNPLQDPTVHINLNHNLKFRLCQSKIMWRNLRQLPWQYFCLLGFWFKQDKLVIWSYRHQVVLGHSYPKYDKESLFLF